MRRATLFAALVLSAPAAAQCSFQQLGGFADLSDEFGTSVSVRGADALIGAPGAAAESGAAYLYKRTGDDWSKVQDLTPSDPDVGARFGASVALLGDWLIAGAPEHGGRGAAYLFQRIAGTWVQAAKLQSSDLAADDRFGAAVALGADVAIVGAPGEDAHGDGAGAVYVFDLQGGSWIETAKVTPGLAAAGDAFGTSVAVEGGFALAGAPMRSSGGVVSIMPLLAGWSEVWQLAAADSQPGDEFGADVALSGSYAVVGAPGRGATYVLKDEAGAWVQSAKLTASGAARFGESVTLAAGTSEIAALIGDSGNGVYGAAYLYKLEGIWVHKAKYTVDLSEAFGRDVSIGGGSGMVGAPASPFGGSENGGAAYAFTLIPDDVSTVTALPSSLTNTSGGFQFMFFDSCVGFAGNAYIVLGSLSGTFPGSTLGSIFLPLNPDGYFGLTLQGTAPGLLLASGIIRAGGDAQAVYYVEPFSLPPSILGTTMHHAFVVQHAFTSEYLFASDPMPLLLLP